MYGIISAMFQIMLKHMQIYLVLKDWEKYSMWTMFINIYLWLAGLCLIS